MFSIKLHRSFCSVRMFKISFFWNLSFYTITKFVCIESHYFFIFQEKMFYLLFWFLINSFFKCETYFQLLKILIIFGVKKNIIFFLVTAISNRKNVLKVKEDIDVSETLTKDENWEKREIVDKHNHESLEQWYHYGFLCQNSIYKISEKLRLKCQKFSLERRNI